MGIDHCPAALIPEGWCLPSHFCDLASSMSLPFHQQPQNSLKPPDKGRIHTAEKPPKGLLKLFMMVIAVQASVLGVFVGMHRSVVCAGLLRLNLVWFYRYSLSGVLYLWCRWRTFQAILGILFWHPAKPKIILWDWKPSAFPPSLPVLQFQSWEIFEPTKCSVQERRAELFSIHSQDTGSLIS